MKSNVDLWNDWYKDLDKPEAYGESQSYEKAAEWLSSLGDGTLEDWGCGKGWFRQFWKDTYVGIDGSNTKFADKKADLTKYRSDVDYVFMRHVIEHNHEWESILRNALNSFKKGFVLILFTPFSEKTTVNYSAPDIPVPDIFFSKQEIMDIITDEGCEQKCVTINSPETAYGVEHIFYIEKANQND